MIQTTFDDLLRQAPRDSAYDRLMTAAGCAADGLIVIPMEGPAQALLIAGGKTPDEALGHEARHALQRWRHGVFMTNSEGVCE